jgi:hypothetical protein
VMAKYTSVGFKSAVNAPCNLGQLDVGENTRRTQNDTYHESDSDSLREHGTTLRTASYGKQENFSLTRREIENGHTSVPGLLPLIAYLEQFSSSII